MKKTFSVLIVCMVVLSCVFAFAACGKSLSGTYEADLALVELRYEFGAFGKVTLTVEPFVGESAVIEGKYEFTADNEITFTFESEENADEAEEYSGVVSFAEGEEEGVKYIKLDGVKYTKID